MPGPRLEVVDNAVRRALRQTGGAALSIFPALRAFARHMKALTDETFDQLKRGGSFRGVTWDEFQYQYIRKTDGVVVPAWGGVPKLRGEGEVQGRLRPSGRRVRQNDPILQDTKRLRARAAVIVALRKDELILGPRGVEHAAWQQRMRMFLFFQIPKDTSFLKDLINQHLMRKNQHAL